MSTNETGDHAGLRRMALAVLQPGFAGLVPPGWLLDRLSQGLGGVALFSRNVQTPGQVASLTAAIHEANPAALVAIDEEGGDVTRLQHATGSSWPGNLALGVVDDIGLTERVAAEIGATLDALGIDLNYAPDADVNVDAANPVIGVRSFGSDAQLVARHTAAWIRGLQGAGVLASAKHFPGHGDTDVDSHHELPVIDLGDPAASPWLQPFRAAVEAGAAAIMSGHIRVPSLDPRPATIAPAVMTDLLREELGFRGLALSDGLEMGALGGAAGLVDGAVQAIAAGVDALCIGGGLADEETVDGVASGVVAAVLEGRLPGSRLAEAAGRVAAAADLRARRRSVPPGGGLTILGEAGLRTGLGAGLEAARRALRFTRALPTSALEPVIAELAAPTNIAVGDLTPSGLVTAAEARWPGLSPHRLGCEADVAGLLASSADSPLWVIVRDPHRFAWMDAVVARIADARPDVVLVETGWPGWTPPRPVAHVVAHGASWASGQAVVELLAWAPDRAPVR